MPGNVDKASGIRELANWILDYADRRGVDITNMALNKLLFFAYEHALIRYNRKLTNAKIEAWDHGPVFREVYRSFKMFGDSPITSRAEKYNSATDRLEVAIADISNADAAIIEDAIRSLVKLPAYILRELSHADDSPWAATWHHKEKTNPGMEISDKIIYRTYESKGVTQ
jgi:uncharacterized phage-associated protein